MRRNLRGDHGQYDWRALMHRPSDPALIAAEIRRLAAVGLKARDISIALKIDMGQGRITRTARPPHGSGQRGVLLTADQALNRIGIGEQRSREP